MKYIYLKWVLRFVIFISYDTESHFSYKYLLFQCVYVFFFTVHL